MAYTSYTTNSIFGDPKLNVYCNSLVNHVVTVLGADASEFILSGTAAVVLQDKALGPVRVIPFVTATPAIFNALAIALEKIFINSQVIKFKTNLRFKVGGYYFEIWLLESITAIDAFNIKVQDITDIPDNLLNFTTNAQ